MKDEYGFKGISIDKFCELVDQLPNHGEGIMLNAQSRAHTGNIGLFNKEGLMIGILDMAEEKVEIFAHPGIVPRKD